MQAIPGVDKVAVLGLATGARRRCSRDSRRCPRNQVLGLACGPRQPLRPVVPGRIVGAIDERSVGLAGMAGKCYRAAGRAPSSLTSAAALNPTYTVLRGRPARAPMRPCRGGLGRGEGHRRAVPADRYRGLRRSRTRCGPAGWSKRSGAHRSAISPSRVCRLRAWRRRRCACRSGRCICCSSRPAPASPATCCAAGWKNVGRRC